MTHFFIASKNFHTGRSGKNKKKSPKKSGKKPTFFHLLLVTSSGLHLFKNLLRSVWGKSGVPNRMKQLSTLYLIVFPLFGRSSNTSPHFSKKKEKRFAWQNADEGMRRKISDFFDFSGILENGVNLEKLGKVWGNWGKLGNSGKIWENWKIVKIGKLWKNWKILGKLRKIWKLGKLRGNWGNWETFGKLQKIIHQSSRKKNIFRFSQKWRKQGPRADLMHNFKKTEISIFPNNCH